VPLASPFRTPGEGNTPPLTPLTTALPTVSIPLIQGSQRKSFDITASSTEPSARFQTRLVMCFGCLCFACFVVSALRLLRRLRAEGSALGTSASGAAGLKAVRLPRSNLERRLLGNSDRLNSLRRNDPAASVLKLLKTACADCRVRLVSLSFPPQGITNTRVRAIGQQSRPIVRHGRHVIAPRRRHACAR
jgi:hypothetical protein